MCAAEPQGCTSGVSREGCSARAPEDRPPGDQRARGLAAERWQCDERARGRQAQRALRDHRRRGARRAGLELRARGARDARHRRRVRLGQDPERAEPARFARGKRARDRRRAVRRPQSAGVARARAAADSWQQDIDDLPRPDDVAESLSHDRGTDAPSGSRPRAGVYEGGARAVPRDARGRRDPRGRGALRSLPARALGRHAAARDDRDEPAARPAGADRGRADDRARRDRASADPRAHEGPQAPLRHRDHPDHARPRRDRGTRGPRARDAGRRAQGAWRRRRHLLSAAARVHARAAQGRAAARLAAAQRAADRRRGGRRRRREPAAGHRTARRGGWRESAFPRARRPLVDAPHAQGRRRR